MRCRNRRSSLLISAIWASSRASRLLSRPPKSHVTSPGVVYLLVGDGAARPTLETNARELNLPNLRFLPLQPQDRFLELLAQSDVCLVTQQRAVSDIVFPSKVIMLLAAARPVIASVGTGSEVARVVAESGAGMTVAPEDPGALADAVKHLRANPHCSAQMGRAGRRPMPLIIGSAKRS